MTTTPMQDLRTKRMLTRDHLLAYSTESESWLAALGRRYTSVEQLQGVLNNLPTLSADVVERFDFKLTPYLAQLMDENDPNCPIRLQYLPSNSEVDYKPYELGDSLAEDHHMPEGTVIVHRYPQRVLFLVQPTCGAYCRYCTRARFVAHAAVHQSEIEASIQYLKAHTEVADVLLSGGDPLLLTNDKLDALLSRIRTECPHVRFLRIGSRLPVQLPTRIDAGLCELLERNNVQMVNIHINHPKEITPLLASRLKMLRKAGVMLGNQVVLLKGVNDDALVLRELFMQCIEMGVRPYYVYSMDLVPGNSHFVVDLARMKELYHQVRGWISGPAVPTFVIDGMAGLGKMPIMPEYIAYDDMLGVVTATNFEGRTSRMDFLAPGFDWNTTNPNCQEDFIPHTGAKT